MLKNSTNDYELLEEMVESKYHIVYDFEDGEYYGHSIEMPTVFGDGQTIEECIENTIEATVYAISYLIEEGLELPSVEDEISLEEV